MSFSPNAASQAETITFSIQDNAAGQDQLFQAALRRWSALPRRRGSQILVCDALTLCEMLLLFAVSLPLLLGVGVPHAAAVAALIAAAGFVTAKIAGASAFDSFESRLAILPGALVCGTIMGGFILARGMPITMVQLYAATVFSTVYLAKVVTLFVRRWIINRHYLTRLVAVAGDNPELRCRAAELLSAREDLVVVETTALSSLASLHLLGKLQLLDEVVLSDGDIAQADMDRLVARGVRILRLNGFERVMRRTLLPISPWDTPVTFIAAPPLRDWKLVAKRTIDVAGALVLTIVCLPVMAVAAVAVALESPGPVLFRQQRFGHYGRPFMMLKFRSMYVEKSDDTGSQLTLRNDPRVTAVGHILRRTSLDELPQLFNVLAGTMSLIGPRPHPSGAKAGGILYDALIEDFYVRYTMMPGLSGLAQVWGLRGNTETTDDLHRRFAKDIEYIHGWTPWRDIRLIFATAQHLIGGKNAF